MILINNYERRVIAQRFPNTIVAATRHHAYVVEDMQVLYLLNKLRHPKPRKQAQK